MSGGGELVAFAIVEEALPKLGALLGVLFTHPWVASYQIGFGPPLLKSSERIVERVRGAKSAREKLDAYLEVCVYDEAERARLADVHRKLTVRRLGLVDAELVDEASADVLDLGVRLHHPLLAASAVQAEMREAGVPQDLLPMRTPPEAMSGRFVVRLADPRNARLLEIAKVRALVGDPASALALELRVPSNVRALYDAWLRRIGKPFVEIELVSHARVTKDGAAR